MTATNMCSNFGSKWYSLPHPLSYIQSFIYADGTKCLKEIAEPADSLDLQTDLDGLA